jgi:hypothetical protein
VQAKVQKELKKERKKKQERVIIRWQDPSTSLHFPDEEQVLVGLPQSPAPQVPVAV